ncbi:TonB-dependent receptor plug domain-containing protein [Tunicatimonas pelagia]|uniref:TonB-dependent receptor plug domain-containing protein n=1 Tax=Tunicatimonas pelagia TaxID=931531 RepID=UPI0026652C7E|nr:TonB-dependent receptor plug domain-containing protein [Tunicatimonas pelagia]WKN40950.1 TonB-dependent receptor plug domain-containing protein [Tunicatimonas pelagia]
MKTYKKYTSGLWLLLLTATASVAATKSASGVYNPVQLRDYYQVDLSDISRSAAFADYILVMDELPQTAMLNVLETLQGRVPGVWVTNYGWNTRVSIRGSWRSPLYVIDGMPVDAIAVNMMNPNDVSTIEVHKGIAPIMYGGRGGNGAIIVNTKRG